MEFPSQLNAWFTKTALWSSLIRHDGVVAGKLGDACDIDPDCRDAMYGTACRSRVCVCDDGFYLSDDRSSCIKRT
jgi:hypothetical protein